MVIVEGKFSHKVLRVVVVLDDLDVLSANIDMRCSLSSTALAEVAEYVGFIWV